MTTSFEEFDVYKKGVVLTKLIFELLNRKEFEKEFAIKDQIKRATISITNNIAEGSEYNNNKQFVRFLKCQREVALKLEAYLYYQKNLAFNIR
ncbi:four helix bundle protein [Flavobacterium sp.]|uniref:four helix bundle protein n=1 Tax=Flavobacterium sp. TaxID=239 RepID=UPI0039E2B0B2